MKVLKFGGSSLATPERIRDVGRIVLDASRAEPIIVVVSAFQGITNQLLDCARLAERGDPAADRALEKIAARHHEAAATLLGPRRGKRILEQVDEQLAELRDVVHGIRLLRHCPPRALDVTASFGERLSALIIAAYLDRFRPALFVDAREFLITDDQFTEANVIFSKTNRLARRTFGPLLRSGSRRVIPVVTGFIGSTADGRTTTIGRNGSDYSAAIVGAAVDASVIEIWTDVNGVLSADPTRGAVRVRPAADHLRRGDGAVVLRRQGAPFGGHCAGGCEIDSAADQEHVRAVCAGHAHLAQGRRRRPSGQGHHVDRRICA